MKITEVIPYLREALELKRKQEEREAKCDRMLFKLRAYGIVAMDVKPGSLADPTRSPGAALDIASLYGIEIGKGFTRISVRASLPKGLWACDPGFRPIGIADRFDICHAVCACILQCLRYGLIQEKEAPYERELPRHNEQAGSSPVVG